MKSHTLVPLFLLPVAALADDPFACVDPAVVDAFVNLYEDDSRYSTSLPADLKDVRFPAEFELVATQTSDRGVTTAFKTEQARSAAFSAAVQAVAAAGWEAKSNPAGLKGFKTVVMSDWTWTCHSSRPEAISITAKPLPDYTLLAVTVHPNPRPEACRTQSKSPTPLMQYLPDLNVPPDAQVEHNASGGGDDEYSARLLLATTMSRDDLLKYFGDQVRAQGWDFDSTWSGRSTAGSVWTRTDKSGAPLYGTFRVAERSTGVFHLRFSVISADPGNWSVGSETVIATQ